MPRSRTRPTLSKVSCFCNFTGLFVTLMGLFVTLLGVTQHFRLNLHVIGPIIMGRYWLQIWFKFQLILSLGILGSGALLFFVGMLMWIYLRRLYNREQAALRQIENEFRRQMFARHGHNPSCSFYREKSHSRASKSSTPSHLSIPMVFEVSSVHIIVTQYLLSTLVTQKKVFIARTVRIQYTVRLLKRSVYIKLTSILVSAVAKALYTIRMELYTILWL